VTGLRRSSDWYGPTPVGHTSPTFVTRIETAGPTMNGLNVEPGS
jgi:hypothetical protein